MNYPEFLKKGDTIGICAPSSGISDPFKIEKYECAKKALEEMGYKIIETSSVKNDYKARSADAKTRAEEFMSLYENPEVKLILFAGGGEFLCEMYDYLDLNKIKSLPPKWTQGYSDCTGINFIFNTLLDIPGIYAQTIKDYAMVPLHESLINALNLVSGIDITQHSFDLYEKECFDDSENDNPRNGYNLTERVEWKTLRNEEYLELNGRLLGGCLDVIKCYIGTKFDNVSNYLEKYKDDGFVWFLECFEFDTPEFLRTLWQLKNAGYFKYCKGIVFGRPLFIEERFDITYTEVLENMLLDLNVPIIYDADIGHVSPQLALINGGFINLKFDYGKAEVKFELK